MTRSIACVFFSRNFPQIPPKAPKRSHRAPAAAPGRPRAPSPSLGKQASKAKHQLAEANAVREFDSTASRWTGRLRFTQGQTIGFDVRALLMVILLAAASTLASALSFGNAGVQLGVAGMTKVYSWVSNITSVSVNSLKGIWETTTEAEDGTINIETPLDGQRGRGSPNADRSKFCKLTPFHLNAIMEFVNWSNDVAGQVTAKQCMNYMEKGAPPARPGQQGLAEGNKRPKKNHRPCPELSPELKCSIPRKSMLYLLRHHLGLDHKYTKKKGVLMTTPKRQTRIRQFMIEFSRALELEKTGEYVIVFTDESYINVNHGRLQSWVRADGDGGVGSTTSKGKRLIILHAITRHGFLTTEEDGFPIPEPALEGTRDSRPTAEWVWPAKSKFKDYHDNMDGAGTLRAHPHTRACT
jgi:hypothetical protein